MRPTIRIRRFYVTWKDLWTGSHGLEVVFVKTANDRGRVLLDVGFKAVKKEPHA